ncbi:LysE family translocator [Roseospira visakhapatnamensis]|uniref:Threonine/homoserine/homoserine lactone efflux protein n=1 Tax=Roseospira visakhapatnamensis TaxID=390880 RepID=A0A7W6R9R0_9PROT|nr:LysE family translocator [Roseospira visakhapatnamensis]MBB4264536.1 threonine/homoserine/homoserine lactone efflux protein [Roseospira visakhapatnamensis]
MTTQQWATYCLTILAVGLIPGPTTVLALATGARHGVARALPAAAGNVAASVLQALASFALVGVVMDTYDTLFRVMLVLGGGYLVWLGVDLARHNPFRALESSLGQAATLRARGFVDVFVVTLMNPKAIVFFVALFPQIIPREGSSMALGLALTVALAAVAAGVFLIYASLGRAIRVLVRIPSVSTGIGLTVAAVLGLMGLGSIVQGLRAQL